MKRIFFLAGFSAFLACQTWGAQISLSQDSRVALYTVPPVQWLVLPGFDPALGTLTDVTLRAELTSGESKISITDNGYQGVWAGTYQPRIYILPPYRGPGFPDSGDPSKAILSVSTDQPFSTDTTGIFGTTSFLVAPSSPATASATVSPCCDAFIGPGDLLIPIALRGIADLPIPRPQLFLRAIEGYGSVRLTATYEYATEADPVPEPTSLMLAASGLILIGLARRRTLPRS